MTTAFLKRTAAATIERRAKEALAKQLPYPRPTVREFRDSASGQAIAISPGSVFIKEGTPVPRSTGFRFKRFGSWDLIADMDSFESAEKLGERGWYLSFILPAVHALGISFNPHLAVKRALHGLMQKVEKRNFNAIEIASANMKTLLGVNWARVAGYPRHLRDNPFVRDLNPHHRRRPRLSWTGINHVVGQRLRQRKAA